jgi:hypothetical protein
MTLTSWQSNIYAKIMEYGNERYANYSDDEVGYAIFT